MVVNLDKQISDIDTALYELYQGGSVDVVLQEQLWRQLERLEKLRGDRL